MFSKAKRFSTVSLKSKTKNKEETETPQTNNKVASKIGPPKSAVQPLPKNNAKNNDVLSQCSSTQSVKSFITPKPVKNVAFSKPSNSIKKPLSTTKVHNTPARVKAKDEIVSAQEVEIRNKDQTINEFIQQIEELKCEIANLQKQITISSENQTNAKNEIEQLNKQLSEISIDDKKTDFESKINDQNEEIDELKNNITLLERHSHSLEQELCSRQVELSSLEEMIGIRDSLCKDLQNKLSDMETDLDETKQRLEMVKGHHALALEANESIRKEYKAELEAIKTKFEDEKQAIVAKNKLDQDNLKATYINNIKLLKEEHEKEKDGIIIDMQEQIIIKENEMRAKLEQMDETTREKIRLCEIQFEERSRDIHEHWSQQEENLQYLNNETRELKYALKVAEDKNMKLLTEIAHLRAKNDHLADENEVLLKDIDHIKDESKKKEIDFENIINKLTADVENAEKEKSKFELSLSVTRDIVHVLTMRLRESDNDIDSLESNVASLTSANKALEEELANYKSSFNNTMLECNEYKDALVNILKSKAALAKEHNRIIEHNVNLIESLQNVEKEAYRELGSIKTELIDDVELLRKESNSQIKKLQEELERKRALCVAAREHAAAAAAAAEQSRVLLADAATRLAALEGDNHRLQHQIEDQQSLVVELSLLRQENEELAITVAKQSSLIEKMKQDAEKAVVKPKSPSLHKKSLKLGKENQQIVSPLRERNY